MSGNDAGDGRASGSKDSTEGDLSARLKRLEAGVGRKRTSASDPSPRSGSSSPQSSALGNAFRMSTEFVAGVIAGGGLGWLFDRGLGTSPWGMIVFLMLGFGAGIYNVMRASGFTSKPSGGQGPKH
jgi:ATP synthase protein I